MYNKRRSCLVITIITIIFQGFVLHFQFQEVTSKNKPIIQHKLSEINLISKQQSSRKQRQANENGKSHNLQNFPPWIDLEMTLPPKQLSESNEFDHDDDHVSEMNVELRFDDDTPPTMITILDPNITWAGSGGEKHIISVTPTDHSHLHLHSQNLQIDPSTTTQRPMPPPRTSSCNCPNMEEIIDAVLQSNILKGAKGMPGLSIQGQKGERGDPIPMPERFLKPSAPESQGQTVTTIKGDRGERGEPGFCTPKDCSSSEPRNNNWRQPPPTPPNIPPEKLYKIVPGALVFPNRLAMLQMQMYSFIGTVAFVEDEEEFYGRVKSGWKSFTMGNRVHRFILSTPNYPTDRPRSKPFIGPLVGPNKFQALSKRPEEEEKKYKKSSSSSLLNDDSSFSSSTKNLIRKMHSDSIPQETKDHFPHKYSILDKTPLIQARIIALNSPLNGNQGGFNQINYQCQRQAMKAQVHGVFRAFHLIPTGSTQTQKSPTLFVNIKNASLGENTKLYSFNMKEIDIQRMVWGRQNSLGKKQNCRGWTFDSLEDAGTSFSLDKNQDHLFGRDASVSSVSSCDKKNTILCLEFLHLNQIHIRHRHNKNKRNNFRLSFDKYLAILKIYDT